MIEIFLTYFPACAFFVTLAFIVEDNWNQGRVRDIRVSAGRVFVTGDKLRVIQEDGVHLCDVDIRSYYLELPRKPRV